MRTAYFLGAGASYAIRPHFPLARDLTVAKLLDRREYPVESDMTIESPERGADVIIEIRAAIAEGRLPAEILTVRLEDVLDRLPVAHGSPGLRERILYLVMKRLTLDGDGTSADLSALLWTAQKRGDLFLTTNYDTLLEWELGLMGTDTQWTPEDPMGPDGRFWIDFGVPDELRVPPGERAAKARRILGHEHASLPVLKLHGSVSWSGCQRCGLFDLDPLFQDGATDSIGGWLTCRRCGGLRQPIFVPPVVRKDVSSHPVIRAVWARAHEELKRVDRIVIAGFSLDPSDDGIRSLLRESDSGRLGSVVVVDPMEDGSVTQRFREVYGPRVETRRESWATFIEGLGHSHRV